MVLRCKIVGLSCGNMENDVDIRFNNDIIKAMEKRLMRNRILSIVAILATLFVVLLSSEYLVEHAAHKCVGAECPVCETMLQCANNIKTVGTAVSVAVVVYIAFAVMKSADTFYSCEVVTPSLISQKVRLDN